METIQTAAQLVDINKLRIASPCPVDWNQMVGDDRERHCSECNLNVYNLSAMTEREIQQLVARTQGRLCGRMYRRSDGTLISQDCPKGLRAVARRVSRTAAAVLTAVMSMSFAFAGNKQKADPPAPNVCREPGVALSVQDPTGAVIPNATVAITDKSGKKKRTGKTNGIGQFTFTGVKSGEYELTISAPGFRNFNQLVRFEEGKLMKLTLKLPVAGTSMEVVVQGEATVVQGMGGLIVTTTDSSFWPTSGSAGRPQPMR
jgi:hypothetical protein